MKGGQLLADVVDGGPAIGLKPQDDAALIQSIAQGNKLALQVLFARHNLRVFRFALRFTHDRATAEAFVSDVFLQVWRNAKRYNGGSQASTWVLSITRNLVISRLTRRAQEVLNQAETDWAEDTAKNPELLTLKKPQLSIFAQCLTKLTAVHREIIDLVYYHERSVDEVALITGLTRNTVKSRMFYARRELARFLQDRASTVKAGPQKAGFGGKLDWSRCINSPKDKAPVAILPVLMTSALPPRSRA